MTPSAHRYPDKWPPYVCMRILTRDASPTLLFIGTLADYEKLEDWRDIKKIFISPHAEYKDVLVLREHGAHYIICQECTEMVAFGLTFVASTANDVIEVWNLKHELIATNKSGMSFHDAFFWNQDLVLVDELAIFIVHNDSLTITERDYGDIVHCAYVEDGELIVRMWDDKEPKKKPTKKIAAKKKPAKKKI